MVPFSFAEQSLVPLGEGALFWPARRALLVADLHLEKASFFARLGQMLPPYDSEATLAVLSRLIERLEAREVWCLGDSFHDDDGPFRLTAPARAILDRLTASTDWTWIVGNHDPGAERPCGGRVLEETVVGGLVLRHEADPADPRPELSGHFHPKLKVRHRGRSVSRRCFVLSPTKLILPAFGALTGGLDACHPAILDAAGGPASALIPTPGKLLRFPLAA
jgi:DNA ligase-associated metallophosphoesterase